MDTTGALLNFMFEETNSVHEKSTFFAVFLDLSKAFDTISFHILMSKT